VDDGKPVLEEKKNRITLRMLLSHTGMFLLSF
jgi:CubicO group peptidase (beta-lactamase class C family)